MKIIRIIGIILLLIIEIGAAQAQTKTIYYNYDGSGNRVQRTIAPNAPIVGTITQPTCTVATGSVVLSGLPSGNWTINTLNEYGDVASAPITGTGTSTTITGLEPGSEPWAYTFTVTNSYNVTSPASVTVTIIYHAPSPAMPIVTNNVIQYYPGAISTPLTASALDNCTLKWYTGFNEVDYQDYGTGLLTNAPTPSTSVAGSSTTYYVSQTDNATTCESQLNYITVAIFNTQSAPAPAPPPSDSTNAIVANEINNIIASDISAGTSNTSADTSTNIVAITDTTAGASTVATIIVQGGDIKVFPNPVKDIVNVQFTGTANNAGSSLQIYDGIGKLFLNKEALQQHNEISMQSASKGTYFLVIITKDKKRQYWKLVKE